MRCPLRLQDASHQKFFEMVSTGRRQELVVTIVKTLSLQSKNLSPTPKRMTREHANVASRRTSCGVRSILVQPTRRYLMLKYAWLAGLVGVVPVLTGMPTAQAAQIYNVTVQEANCGGSASNCSAGGNGSTFSGAPITFQWQSNLASGGLDFNLQPGGTN